MEEPKAYENVKPTLRGVHSTGNPHNDTTYFYNDTIVGGGVPVIFSQHKLDFKEEPKAYENVKPTLRGTHSTGNPKNDTTYFYNGTVYGGGVPVIFSLE